MQDPKKNDNIYFLLLTVPIFWGTSYVAAKIGMRDLLPLNLAIVRFAMASIIFSLILLIKKKNLRIDKQDIPEFFLLGFLAISFFYYIHYTGLQYTTSTNAGLIMATSPIFAALFCIITKRENVNLRIFLGILIAFIGVLFIISHGNLKRIFQQKTLFGDSLIMINALMWAWVTLRGKIVLNKYSPFVAMAYIHIFGTILLLPFAFFSTAMVKISLCRQLPTISWTTVLASAYLAIFCSVYSYFIWYLGVSKIGAVKTATFNYFNPVMASLSGFIVFHEQLTIYIALGGILVILGVYLTNRNSTTTG
ncbi:MAG TPA: EamA family transporter [Firmicutes bacterium]|jgi:drug/metabolite transporter (DMT)-like permease|nr:EamA family transporter [Bacillota bacterium]